MSWIETTPYPASTGRLRRLYDRVKGPEDNVDNIMLAHSLRPHSMEGHMALYKSALHHSGNTIPKWFLEVLGVFVSMLNECDYCVEHHFAGLLRLRPDASEEIRRSLEGETPSAHLAVKHEEALDYARILTLSPVSVAEDSVAGLREQGWSDGEILEINQVVAYFNYANRTVLGLGVTTEGDVLGLSPGDSSDPTNWNHD
ncbi:MAG: alkylhydroperoxidase [Rhodothermales bacterium]|nr:alkylhydroperoxidase [Rhodothermales bacterium]